MWSEWRTVTKTATVGLHGNTYEVDAALVGRKVELVFDPFDLTHIEVRWQHRPMGHAVPHRIGRHVHHKARPDDTTPPAATATGIDYLELIEAQHTGEIWPNGSATPNSLMEPYRPAARRTSRQTRSRCLAITNRLQRTGARMIEKLQSHYGFSRTPFGRGLAPQMLHRHAAHAEAVARIGWCIRERGLGVITGEVGAGKTVAVRAALNALDSSRHTIIYLGNPAVGGRGLYGCIVTALGGNPASTKRR